MPDLLSSLSIVRLLDALGKAREECKGHTTNWEVKFLAALHAEGYSVEEMPKPPAALEAG